MSPHPILEVWRGSSLCLLPWTLPHVQHIPNLTLTDIDECKSVFSICSTLSRCVNTNGTYNCYCFDGTQKDSSGNCIGMVNCDA